MEKLTLRALKSKDLFTITRFFKKIGVEAIIAEFTKDAKFSKQDEEAVEERGVGIISSLSSLLFENLDSLEKEINVLLADLTNTDEDTISNLGLAEYSGLIMGLVQKEEIKDFLSSFGSLVKLVPKTK